VTGRGGPSASEALRDHHSAVTWIEYEPAELSPWRVRFDFVARIDDESGEREYEMLGHTLTRPLSVKGAREIPAGEHEKGYLDRRRTFDADQRIYRLVAEHLLSFDSDAVTDVRSTMAGLHSRRLRRALLVDDWRKLGGPTAKRHDAVIDTLAPLYSMDRSTVYRELRRAESEGLIPEGLRHPTRSRAAT
jgi:hypothetical protein